jgi:hypothetical protein
MPFSRVSYAMPDETDTLTRLLQWLGGLLVAGGGLIGWANYRLARARQPVTLRLDEAQIEVHHANAHKITVDGLVSSAQVLRADNDRLREERDYWQARAEKAERHLLEQEVDIQLPPKPGNGKG